MAEVQVKSVNWWHERLADWMINNPDKTLGEAATFFGCTQSWLSVIKNSDVFKEHWAHKSAVASYMAIGDVASKVNTVAELALDAIVSRLERQSAVMPVSDLLSITDMTMKRMGMSADAKAGAPAVNINITQVTATDIARAKEKIAALHGRKPSSVDAVDVELLPAPEKVS